MRLNLPTPLITSLTVGGLVAAVAVAPPAAARGSVPAAAPHVAAPHVAAPHAVAATSVGKLSPRNCAFDAGAVATCNLYAKTGTSSLNGTAVPIWGFSANAADDPTAPG